MMVQTRWLCPALINPEVPIAVVPILRAGLAEGAQTLLPLHRFTILAWCGMKTLLPSCYLNKLPERFDPKHGF